MAKRPRKLAVVKTFPLAKVEEPRWTPLSVLEEFTEDVRSGKIKAENVMVFYVAKNAEGRLIPHHWTQNVSIAEQIAYGELIKTLALEEWKTP